MRINMKTPHEIFLDNRLKKSVLELWKDQKYFVIQEIVPKRTYQERKEKCIELFRPEAILTLIEIRLLADAPITINTWMWGEGGFQYRGFRPASYAVDYSDYSQHNLFNAFDFDVRGNTAEEFRTRLLTWKREGKLPYLTGIENKVNWVHIDCRMTQLLDNDGLFWFNP